MFIKVGLPCVVNENMNIACMSIWIQYRFNISILRNYFDYFLKLIKPYCLNIIKLDFVNRKHSSPQPEILCNFFSLNKSSSTWSFEIMQKRTTNVLHSNNNNKPIHHIHNDSHARRWQHKSPSVVTQNVDITLLL